MMRRLLNLILSKKTKQAKEHAKKTKQAKEHEAVISQIQMPFVTITEISPSQTRVS
jgi:hypothetical protein